MRFVLVWLVMGGLLQGPRLVHGAPSFQGAGDFRSDAEQLLQVRDLLALGLGRHHWLQPGGAEWPGSWQHALLNLPYALWHAGILRNHRDVMNKVQPF